MDILLYVLVFSIGFGAGVMACLMVMGKRLDKAAEKPEINIPQPRVEVNVSEDLVARYLDSFNLVAVPKDMLREHVEANQTRH